MGGQWCRSERCLLHVWFVLVLFDGTWGQSEVRAAGMVDMRRLTKFNQG